MNAIASAAKYIGGAAAVARLLGVTPPAVSQWLSGKRQAPVERCPAIEHATAGSVTCEQLRPDVRWVRVPDPTWPHPDGRPCVDVAASPTPADHVEASHAG